MTNRQLRATICESLGLPNCSKAFLIHSPPEFLHSRLSLNYQSLPMASTRLIFRASRATARIHPRLFSSMPSRFVDTNDRHNDTAEEYRRYQIEKPLNPHMTNTNSTISNEMPNIGKDSAPPELITSVDPDFVPQDSVPEKTEHMTGGTQAPGPGKGPNAELEVGEIEGGTFRVEPLRRTGEDINTIRARLLCKQTLTWPRSDR